jgi:hypothetical protein
VTAHRDRQAKSLNRQTADHEDGSSERAGEEHQCGDGEKEPGWQDQQPGVFHALSSLLLLISGFAQALRAMRGNTPGAEPGRPAQKGLS